MTIEEFDRLGADDAREELARCCGSAAWVERMMAQRPFLSVKQVLDTARDVWTGLTPADWREAFAHHPRIGDLASLQRRFASTADLAGREQAGVAAASQATLEALAEGNRAYHEKFGYIFIVFASGRSADEMLELLRQRMGNDPDTELAIAAEEQWKILRRRLDALLGGPR